MNFHLINTLTNLVVYMWHNSTEPGLTLLSGGPGGALPTNISKPYNNNNSIPDYKKVI